MRAEKQLTKITEHNVKICEQRVLPVKLHVGSKARCFRTCRYVDRGPKRRCNYTRPFWVVTIHSPEVVSIYQKSDVLLVPTEKCKLFYVRPYGWLDHIDGPSDTRETGTTLGLVRATEDPTYHLAKSDRVLQLGLTAAACRRAFG